MARTNNNTIKISKTSEQTVKNGNPDHSNTNHATVTIIMTPKETCLHFHKSTSAAIKEKEREISQAISTNTENKRNALISQIDEEIKEIISHN